MGSKPPAPKTQIVINRAIAETRLAVLEDGRLIEFYRTPHFAEQKTARLKEVYLGRVRTVDSALNAAFVDLGLPQDGFLRAQDAAPPLSLSEKTKSDTPRIAEILHEGQPLLVQVETEATAGKGPRLRTDIALAGRHLVFFPLSSGIKVSSRMKAQDKANSLASVLQDLLKDSSMAEQGGYIIRTQQKMSDSAELSRELADLQAQWHDMYDRANTSKAPAKLTEPKDWALETIDRLPWGGAIEIICDNTHLYTLLNNWNGEAEKRRAMLGCYTDPLPIFEAFNIEDQLETARARRVALPGGGELVIDETEALTVIDINSARTDPRGRPLSAGESAFRTNSEAADEIARQLRLRALGGLVVIDFIHMHKGQDDDKVVARLRRALRADPCPTEVGDMSRFGLVELTRKRERRPLSADYAAPRVAIRPASLTACAYDLCRAIETELRRAAAAQLTAAVDPELLRWLDGEGGALWRSFASRLAVTVTLIPDPVLKRGQFHVSRA